MTEDRTLRALRALVMQMLPQLGYLGLHEYRVVSVAGDRVDLQVVRKASGLPDLPRVEAWPGVAGAGSTPALGSLVLVEFIATDPARPFIAYYCPPGAPGFLPTAISMDASGTVAIGASADAVDLGAAAAPVLRHGDTISITPGNGAGVVAGIVTVTSGTAEAPPAVSRVRA